MQAESGSNLELGKIYLRACNLDKAIKVLESELETALNKSERNRIAETLPLLLRILAERHSFSRIEYWKERATPLLSSMERSSGVCYVLGIIDIYSNKIDSAELHFHAAVKKAEMEGDGRLFHQGRLGLITVKIKRDLYPDALIELDECLQSKNPIDQDILPFFYFTKAIALRELKQFNEALTALEKAQSFSEGGDMYVKITFFYFMGALNHEWSQLDVAKKYLELAQILASEKNLTDLSRRIDSRLEKIAKEIHDQNSVFLIESPAQVLLKTQMGEKDLTKQPLVVELLKLFVQARGQVLNKEDIVKNIWKEEYDPRIHDNKIYVTINRLRKVLEACPKEPKLLLQKTLAILLIQKPKFAI